MLIKQNAKKGKKKLLNLSIQCQLKKKLRRSGNSGADSQKDSAATMIFPSKISEESDHSSACTISSHVHHMSHDRAVHGYFLTVWWPEVIVFVTPKMGSTSNTKYSSHQFATQSLGKMKFPHLLPPKKHASKELRAFSASRKRRWPTYWVDS